MLYILPKILLELKMQDYGFTKNQPVKIKLHMPHVLVRHCCIANYLKTQLLKTNINIYYFTQILWIRISGAPGLG